MDYDLDTREWTSSFRNPTGNLSSFEPLNASQLAPHLYRNETARLSTLSAGLRAASPSQAVRDQENIGNVRSLRQQVEHESTYKSYSGEDDLSRYRLHSVGKLYDESPYVRKELFRAPVGGPGTRSSNTLDSEKADGGSPGLTVLRELEQSISSIRSPVPQSASQKMSSAREDPARETMKDAMGTAVSAWMEMEKELPGRDEHRRPGKEDLSEWTSGPPEHYDRSRGGKEGSSSRMGLHSALEEERAARKAAERALQEAQRELAGVQWNRETMAAQSRTAREGEDRAANWKSSQLAELAEEKAVLQQTLQKIQLEQFSNMEEHTKKKEEWMAEKEALLRAQHSLEESVVTDISMCEAEVASIREAKEAGDEGRQALEVRIAEVQSQLEDEVREREAAVASGAKALEEARAAVEASEALLASNNALTEARSWRQVGPHSRHVQAFCWAIPSRARSSNKRAWSTFRATPPFRCLPITFWLNLASAGELTAVHPH
ncbi:hypothetical protein CYMTET_48363 [Cymbomonas tetramitiformis]|uniref:Uncharacterized protein n=1 Tax=Cymbomonas tetramitiformis TaxID=36881 RepID=A0AAE0BUB2_9CHLO|nr:hypothetical protein CYMTET_48363 [Cymbomonas tetramitiformis]